MANYDNVSAVPQNLQPGDVVNGYRYIGKDPAQDRKNPQSWAPLQGDDFLKTLDPAIGGVVKAYAEGRQPPPTSFFLKSPYGQMIMRDVARYDPTFDLIDYPARVATRKDFTSGQSARQLNALNTALGHMGLLYNLIPGTASGSYPWINYVKNQFTSMTGGQGPTNYETAVGPIASELTRVYRQAGGSEQDIKDFEKNISVDASRDQKLGALKTLTELLKSKIDAMGDQYNKGMGTSKQGIQLLNPAAAKVYELLLNDEGAGSDATQKPAPTSASPAPALPLGTQGIKPPANNNQPSVDDLLKKYGVQ